MRKFVFFSVLLAAFPALSAQNMNRHITLRVTSGQTVRYYFTTDSSNTMVKIRNGSDESLIKGSCYGTSSVKAASSTIIFYGNIKEFSCNNNGTAVSGMDISNPGLTALECVGNKLRELNLSSCVALCRLNCSDNLLSKLYVGACKNMYELNCQNNLFTSLNVSACGALEYLYCSGNKLEQLDVSGLGRLKTLSCAGNRFRTSEYDAIMCSLPIRKSGDNAVFYPLEDSKDTNAVRFMASNAKNAGKKYWTVKYSYTGSEIQGTSGSYVCPYMNNCIVLSAKRSSAVRFKFAVNDTTMVRIQTGSFDTLFMVPTGWAKEMRLFVMLSKVRIYGDIVSFNCSGNGAVVDGVSIEDNTMLQGLFCASNGISSLDVSKNPALKYLDCSNNRLTSLHFGTNHGWMSQIDCYGNPFTTRAYDELMCGMPSGGSTSVSSFRPLENSKDTNYAKFMAANSENAISKKWLVKYGNENNSPNVKVPATSGSYVCPGVDVREAVAEPSMRAWPNPARTELHISNADGEVLVCDLTGRVVYRAEAGRDEIVVNVADWAKGMYFVRAGRSAVKVVKE